jgi:flagellar hook-associated protein 2
MAVSSATNSSTTSIDVASIVEQLMKVENKPLESLTSKIDQQKLIISDLGTIKSKVSAFQDALKEF